MKRNNYYLFEKKLKFLNASKKVITNNGWSSELFNQIENETKISNDYMNLLFPKGYKELLIFALDNLNYNLEKELSNLKLYRISLSKRVKEIIFFKIKIMNKEKLFYKKIFLTLIFPMNKRILVKQLYKSIDLIWYLANDKSTDFNFYTKRLILSGIYSRVILHFFNNSNLKDTEIVLEESLSKVSLIPEIKNKFKFLTKNVSNLWNFIK